jgi:hypothetical protein
MIITIILSLLLIIGVLLVYAKRRSIKRYFIKLKIDSRRNKRRSLEFDDEDQRRTIHIAERLIREPLSELTKSTRHDEYIIGFGEIYAVITLKSICLVNGKIVKSINISDKIRDTLIDKYNTRVETTRNNVIKKIDSKKARILDIILEDIEEVTKIKKSNT